ncbi:MAG: glycosyltransferase 87 family protein [Streptosporangiaceae bacterium]
MQAQAESGPDFTPAGRAGRPQWHRVFRLSGLVLAALLFVTSVTAYLTDAVFHVQVLSWFDLNVYNDAGLIVRQLPRLLYTWQLTPSVKYTYTPFAAMLFAGGSLIPWATLRWLMTALSIASIPLSAWLTIGAMGRRGASRAGLTLAIAAIALWIEPVTRGLYLGQIEPLLLLLVVWDLTQPDHRRWKGVGVGIAAGIKLIPLIFIPYLLLAGKIRQAVVATATFLATIVVGFIALPGPSSYYWLTGYFIKPGRTGGVDSLVNQSLLAFFARQAGGTSHAEPIWLPVAALVGLAGITAGAILARSGRPTQGWVLVGITSVLVSPISWDHHWVWVVALLAMLGSLAMSARRGRAWIFVVLLLITVGVYGSWPWNYTGPNAYVPKRGLLGWFTANPQTQVTHLHGWQLLSWNLYIAGGAVVFLAMVAVAVVVWRSERPTRPRSEPLAATGSTVDALLARADAVLTTGQPPTTGQPVNGAAPNDGKDINGIAARPAGDGEPTRPENAR